MIRLLSISTWACSFRNRSSSATFKGIVRALNACSGSITILSRLVNTFFYASHTLQILRVHTLLLIFSVLLNYAVVSLLLLVDLIRSIFLSTAVHSKCFGNPPIEIIG